MIYITHFPKATGLYPDLLKQILKENHSSKVGAVKGYDTCPEEDKGWYAKALVWDGFEDLVTSQE